MYRWEIEPRQAALNSFRVNPVERECDFFNLWLRRKTMQLGCRKLGLSQIRHWDRFTAFIVIVLSFYWARNPHNERDGGVYCYKKLVAKMNPDMLTMNVCSYNQNI